MKRKAFYLSSLIALILGCWLYAALLWGWQDAGKLSALAVLVVFSLLVLVRAAQKARIYIWIFTGSLMLAGLFLPASVFIKIFPTAENEPLSSGLALILLLLISSALIVAALLLNASLHLQKWDSEPSTGEEQPHNANRFIVLPLILSALLLLKALHSFYWFMVWDATVDSLGVIWLPILILAVLISSMILSIAQSDSTKVAGLIYLLLIPVLIVISVYANRVDFRQLTEQHAELTSQALEHFHAQSGRYPDELGELTPWYIFPLPGPVIFFGEGWCYDSGEEYYRLGYIDRDHWSSPYLIGQLYKNRGTTPDLPPICEREVQALMQRYPNNYWIFEE